MRPRRTPESNAVFTLDGGNEDNYLYVALTPDEDSPMIQSVWEPSEEERLSIAKGNNILLTVFGTGHPPVTLNVTTAKPGKGTP